MSYVYLALTILLTVYGQLVFKWQVGMAGPLPEDWEGKLRFVGMLLIEPWILSGFAAALLASVFWILAVSRLELSHAYPFMSLSFVLVFLGAAVFFHEAITPAKAIGLTLIVAGLIIAGRG
jgi:multidrug transporter EmrE-like cation transporter